MEKRIAFIGCGNMGEALLKGLLKKGLFKNQHIIVADFCKERRDYIKRRYKVKVALSNAEAAKSGDIILLCIKPQDMQTVLNEIKNTVDYKLVVSIAAGISTDHIAKQTGAKRVIRAMPNTPALVGAGITAIAASRRIRASDRDIADKIFSGVGKTIHLDESHINTVTAISGSGPAYFFLLMEAMINTAISAGIKRDIAQSLVMQTALGAAILQNKTKQDPVLLRSKVTSKGGVTEAALSVFAKKGFEDIINEAIGQAVKRARELS